MSAEDVSETRILAVDDEQRGVELLAQALRRLGQVDGAMSADEAWEMFQRERYDLVVSDQRMPGMSGVELLSRVAEVRPGCGRMLVTGYADLESTIDAINAGRVHAYVSKPCDPRDLRESVRGVLDRVRLGEENSQLLGELTEKNVRLEQALAELEAAQARIVRSEQLAAVGKTVSMIVHDLRGPIAVLQANGKLLADEAAELPADERKEVAREVLDEALSLERMCALLRETGPSGGRGHRETCVVGDVAHAAATVVAEAASLQGVVIDLEVGDEDVEIELDRAALRRALVNLMYNAIDAMADGGELRITTGCDDGCVSICVADTGPGVSPEIADRLFEPFETLGKAKGTGLGLAIVREVAEDHGGSVDVAKAEGGGAAFTMTLPRA